MKKHIIKNALLFLFLSTSAFAGQMAKYEVTIKNLTKGQPLTPAAIIVHDGSFKLFELGSPASKGLYELAEDGMTTHLQGEVEAQSFHFETLSGLTLPGQENTTTFEASPKSKISVASMLAKTNDAFASGLTPLSLYLKKGQSYSKLLGVFDAGSELNNELEAFIPAFGNAGVRTDRGEGFVTFHPGLQGIGDLDLQNIAFAPQAARITIKRIK